jgi:hypothetical protein
LIDLFTLALTHSLIAVALWRLLFRPELDVEDAGIPPRRPWVKVASEPAEEAPGDA